MTLLTRTECNIMRGIAILGIALHNYCHWLGPVVKENEYAFSAHNAGWLQAVCASPDGLLPMHILSFFGHYGVPLFVFLSAYGLTLKYENPLAPPEPAGRFIAQHYGKLWRMMIGGFALFLIVDRLTPAPFHYDPTRILGIVLMVGNVYPDPDHEIWPGPYWFFGLMVQLYVVWRLLMYRRHWAWTAALMAVCLAVQYALPSEGGVTVAYRYNFMGSMLPFGFGMLCARYGSRVIFCPGQPWVLAVCALLLCTVVWDWSLSFVGWALVPLAVCMAGVYVAQLLTRTAWLAPLARGLATVGVYSAAVFVTHPAARKIFIPISRQGDFYTGLMLYIIAAAALAWVFHGKVKS